MKSIKLVFNNETKKLSFPKDYESLESYVNKAYKDLPQNFKFFYVDADGDTISVTNDDDLISFKESSDKPEAAKLVIARDQDEAQLLLNTSRVGGNDTFRISQNFVAPIVAQNPTNDQNQTEYYEMPKETAQSVVKDIFITPQNLPLRQGSVMSNAYSTNTERNTTLFNKG